MSQFSPSYEEEDFQDTHRLVKQRQRYQRRPKGIADLMGRLMARKGYGQVETQDELQNVWQSIVDSKLVSKTRPSVVRAGVLQVHVESSVILQQMEFQKRTLLKALQAKLPGSKIKELRFKVSGHL